MHVSLHVSFGRLLQAGRCISRRFLSFSVRCHLHIRLDDTVIGWEFGIELFWNPAIRGGWSIFV
jgi:hypothetical protein